MAVVEVKSNLKPDYLDTSVRQPDPVEVAARKIFANGNVANDATDSALSTYHLMDLPSDCILAEETFFKVDGWGFAQIQIGTETDPTALVNQTKVTEAIATPIANGDANHAQRLWEVLGIASDPGGNIGIYASAVAGATGAGTMQFQLAYLYH